MDTLSPAHPTKRVNGDETNEPSLHLASASTGAPLHPLHISMRRVYSDVIFQTIKHRLLHTFSTTDPIFKVPSA